MSSDRIIDRFDQYMKEKGLNDNQVTVNANLSVGLLGNARRGNYDLGKKAVEKILSFYQDLSRTWLLTGEGEMLNGNVHTFELKTDRERAVRRVPVYDMDATAGFHAIYRDYPAEAEDYISIPNLPPVDGAIYARGDSMSPLIESGDIIIFKKVELVPGNILWGHIYIVTYLVSGDEFTVLKYIRKSDKNGYVRLESFNPRYDPQEIPSSGIIALALVKASITFHTIG